LRASRIRFKSPSTHLCLCSCVGVPAKLGGRLNALKMNAILKGDIVMALPGRLLPKLVAMIATLTLLPIPMRSSAEDLSSYNGAQLYRRFCASCHGARGLGDGSVAPSLKIMVPDLTRIAKRRGGEFPDDLVRRIIDGRAVQVPHGTRDMPVWGYEFRQAGAGSADAGASADELVNRLLDYVRSIQKQ
jgi:mono/diheme cytochrome c family protein